MRYILAAAHSLQAAAGTSVVGLGMLAELQEKGLYTPSSFGPNTSEQLSQTPLHSSKTTASAKTLPEEQFIHKPSTSENLLNAPHKVTMPAGLYYRKTRSHREQKPEKVFHLLALRITICLTLCDGSQEEMLLKGKERRKKGAEQDKPSQQHPPPLLSSYPLRPWKHAATLLKKSRVSISQWGKPP